MKRRVYIDIEADGLLDTITRIWCIVAKDIDTNEVFTFHPKEKTKCSTCNGDGSILQNNTVSTCKSCKGKGEGYAGDHNEFKEEFIEFFNQCEKFIGHNLIGYDKLALEKILNLKIPLKNCTDTLILSRLFRPVSPPSSSPLYKVYQETNTYVDDRKGGHSLKGWGKRLGFSKLDFEDFSVYTDKMLAYCIVDVELGVKIWETLEEERQGIADPSWIFKEYKSPKDNPVPFGDLSIRLEHSVAACLRQQELNGFQLDIDAAESLRDDTEILLQNMDKELDKHFPPVRKFVGTWKPKFKKDGTFTEVSKRILKTKDLSPSITSLKSSIINPDGSVTLYWSEYDMFESQEFNPNSSQQIAQRLLDRGWKPKVFTPKGAPSTAKKVLKEAIDQLKGKFPEVAFLENYSIIYYNNQKAKKWLEIVHSDGRVYGRINPIGAGTHRCTHSEDNMANIASVKFDSSGKPLKGVEGEYGYDCRNCWTVPENKILVGADASGIQLRALAHYMNDPQYTKHLLEGDIHTVNQHAAGIKDRPTAKTFIYAWLLGAGDEKIGSIVGVDPSEYQSLINYGQTEKKFNQPLIEYVRDSLRQQERKATKESVLTIIKGYKTKKQFLERTPALKRLKEQDIPEATKKGYLIGLDKRKLWIPSEHLAMSLYLQGFEAVIMKTAICLYHDALNRKGIDFKQVVFVHDEVQVECYRKDSHIVGQTIVDSIKKAGEFFKTNCPLDGEYKIGRTWAETH